MEENIEKMAERIARGGKTVFFTGAGISTESGIPDYRSQGGIWDRYRPVYFDEFMSSLESRKEYWRRWVELYGGLLKARPNPAHLALAGLFEAGLLEGVITQNVDGLHEESGIPPDRIIELHGNTRRIRCMHCRQTTPTDAVWDRLNKGDAAPACDCGGFLKPDTVSFGQAMPREAVERAVSLSRTSDVFIVVGSTLLVQPAAHMPFYAKESGAWLAVVNLSETPCDELCDALIREKAGKVLSTLEGKLREMAALDPRR
ncbi:MAG: sigma factor regulator FecR [Desulfobacteraceae bacterium]|jgi:NAD-dependent deacetylase|nr:sigma factor regulator FecR [Desulfobacteraceae bacterium]